MGICQVALRGFWRFSCGYPPSMLGADGEVYWHVLRKTPQPSARDRMKSNLPSRSGVIP